MEISLYTKDALKFIFWSVGFPAILMFIIIIFM